MTLAKRLRDTRKARGFSQTELAQKVGISQSFISAIETKGQEDTAYLPEIAHALGVDAFWLKKGVKTIVAGDPKINEVVELMKTMSKEGRAIVLDKARDVAKEYAENASKQTG